MATDFPAGAAGYFTTPRPLAYKKFSAESGVTEDSLDAGHGPRDRMPPAEPITPTGKRHIYGIFNESFCKRFALERLSPGIDTLLDFLLGAVNLITGSRALVGRELAELLETNSQRTFFPR